MPMTKQQMEAKIAQLEAELAAKNSRANGIKVSEKGAVSFYGLGRMPVTLYASQWVALLSKSEEVKSFVKLNFSKLTFKTDDQRKDAASKLGIEVPAETPAPTVPAETPAQQPTA